METSITPETTIELAIINLFDITRKIEIEVFGERPRVEEKQVSPIDTNKLMKNRSDILTVVEILREIERALKLL